MEIIAINKKPVRSYRTSEFSRNSASVKIIELMANVPDATLADILHFSVEGGGDILQRFALS